MSVTTWGSHFPYMITVPIILDESGKGIYEQGQEIKQWVNNTFPNLVESNWNRHGDWYLRWAGGHFEVHFRCPNQTAMFKLAWGGL